MTELDQAIYLCRRVAVRIEVMDPGRAEVARLRRGLKPLAPRFNLTLQLAAIAGDVPDLIVERFQAAALNGGQPVDHELPAPLAFHRSEEHTSELQSLRHLVCRLLLEKKK